MESKLDLVTLIDFLDGDDGVWYDRFGLWAQGKRDTAWLVGKLVAANVRVGDAGACWFCKATVPIDALIAGYDTFDEQRLACLACNERMQGNWRPASADPDGRVDSKLREG